MTVEGFQQIACCSSLIYLHIWAVQDNWVCGLETLGRKPFEKLQCFDTRLSENAFERLGPFLGNMKALHLSIGGLTALARSQHPVLQKLSINTIPYGQVNTMGPTLVRPAGSPPTRAEELVAIARNCPRLRRIDLRVHCLDNFSDTTIEEVACSLPRLETFFLGLGTHSPKVTEEAALQSLRKHCKNFRRIDFRTHSW